MEQGNALVKVTLYAWPILSAALFAFLTPRRAILVALLGGWLFLPIADIPIDGLPDLSRTTSGVLGVLIGLLLFDLNRILTFRPHWMDLPAAVVSISPFFTALANGLEVKHGLATSLELMLLWGIASVIGKLYFSGAAALRELCVAIFVAGIVYVPLCLIEIRMSPQLHTWVYGYHQHSFGQAIRFGGYRPTVFMEHGLEVGLFMSFASIAGVWLWVSGALRRLFKVPMAVLVPILLVTTVMVKSTGAIVLLAVALGALFVARRFKTRIPVAILLLLPLVYGFARSNDLWTGRDLTDAIADMDAERADSLQYRFNAEDILIGHALKRPLLGWGGYGRNRPSTFDTGIENPATDGLWIIQLGWLGLVWLIPCAFILLAPGFLLLYRLPPAHWTHPHCASAVALAMILAIYTIDCLLNAMSAPLLPLLAGGLGWALAKPATVQRVAADSRRPSDRIPAVTGATTLM